jgi:hypothetical protein
MRAGVSADRTAALKVKPTRGVKGLMTSPSPSIARAV